MARYSNPRERQRVQQWARELLAQPNVYILDTETTGVGKKDQVIQIGIINKQGEAILDTLIKPTVPITDGASAVNGLTMERLEDAPSFADIFVDLSSKLAGAHIVAYNIDFDWRLLEQTSRAFGLPMFRTPHKHCAMKQYAAYRGIWNGRRRSYRWHKLTDAAHYEKIEVSDAHTALGDVLMTLKLLEKLAAD